MRNQLYQNIMKIISTTIILLLFYYGSKNLNYNWQWYRLVDLVFNRSFEDNKLLQGFYQTIKLSGISFILSLILGTLSVLLHYSHYKSLFLISKVYVSAIRNTPLLIQIFLIYFVISPVFNINETFSAIIALSTFEGAYISEILRGGVQSIDKGQFEASYSLGMTKIQTLIRIITPQVFRITIPSITGQTVSLVKDSALVSVIAVNELTMQAQSLIADSFLSLEIWFFIATVYLLINLLLSYFSKYLERKMSRS
ncbi:MAG: amino acid ABC transporter permease [Candidatus Delongbacteria bacterium]|nr:amino acid ABC transporter permease [Candidatus Delongbacteria bacterium]MBN2834451.1 amino acid ABC transporter permease [Candidatus Delongbacteria bacterium]